MKHIIGILFVLIILSSCDPDNFKGNGNEEFPRITGFVNVPVSPEDFYNSLDCINSEDILLPVEVKYITKLPVEEFGTVRNQILTAREKYFNRIFTFDVCNTNIFVIPRRINIVYDEALKQYKETWKTDSRILPRPESTNDGLDLDGDLEF